MALFNFTSPLSLIDSVAIVSTLNGSNRAYIHIPEDKESEAYQRVMLALEKNRFMVIPAEYQGKPALEVRGFDKPEKFLKQLELTGLTDGCPNKSDMAEEKFSTKELLRHRTLNIAGKLYVVGDVALAGYALRDLIKDQAFSETFATLGYASGTQFLIKYAKDQTPVRLQDMARDMLHHLHASGIDAPVDSAILSAARETDHTTMQRLDRWFRKHPSELMNASFGFAGLMMVNAAQHYSYSPQPWESPETIARRSKRTDYQRTLDTVLGSTTFVSGLTSIAIKEKERDKDAPPKEGLERMWEWVQERPLRIAGYGYMISTVIHGLSTYSMLMDHYREYKSGGHTQELVDAVSRAFRGVFVITNLMAEFLISLSSKGHGHGVGDDSNESKMNESAFRLAADLINRLEPEHRAGAEEHLANFLSHKDALNLPKEKIIASMRHEAETLKENPWAMNAPSLDRKQSTPHGIVLPGTDGFRQRLMQESQLTPSFKIT